MLNMLDKNQLNLLKIELLSNDCAFVRCIKPNLHSEKNYFDEILRQTIYDIKQLKAKKLKTVHIDKQSVETNTPNYHFEEIN